MPQTPARTGVFVTIGRISFAFSPLVYITDKHGCKEYIGGIPFQARLDSHLNTASIQPGSHGQPFGIGLSCR